MGSWRMFESLRQESGRQGCGHPKLSNAVYPKLENTVLDVGSIRCFASVCVYMCLRMRHPNPPHLRSPPPRASAVAAARSQEAGDDAICEALGPGPFLWPKQPHPLGGEGLEPAASFQSQSSLDGMVPHCVLFFPPCIYLPFLFYFFIQPLFERHG